MTDTDFVGFPKMGRLNRTMVVTEKIDGTNAQVCISEDGTEMRVGSRTKWITPSDDNHGFAAWAYAHKDELLQLGPGRHFGEWYGRGIQRGYGLTERKFALFNTLRWALAGTEPERIVTDDPRLVKMQTVLPECIGLVPKLYKGPMDTHVVNAVLEDLRVTGSRVNPGYMNPEGIVVYHVHGGVGFKVTLKDDHLPKSLSGA